MANNSIDQIKQALSAAENSIRIAKQLIEAGEGGHTPNPAPEVGRQPERNGINGIYDGEKMATSSGEVYPVPGNYASKSLLVVGDTLKMYEENGEKRFKQIEHVKRHKTTGLLVKKDGKFRAITPEGSYKVLTESINHFNGEVGDEVILHLPAANLTSPFAAIETVHKKNKRGGETEVIAEEKRPEEVRKVVEVPKPPQKPEPLVEPKKEEFKKPKSPPSPIIEAKPVPKKIEKAELTEVAKVEVSKEPQKAPESTENPIATANPEDELS